MSCLCSVMTKDLSVSEHAYAALEAHFGPGTAAVVSVPGRVNLIGEHIDYHNLPVLPMAIERRIAVAFRPRADAQVRAFSSGAYGERSFHVTEAPEPGPPGDWANYLKASLDGVRSRWRISRGLDAAISADLPAAAGLSSSSALLVGFTLALLEANGYHPGVEELMSVLPEAEQFVGTRGGAMDHAVVLGAKAGCALLVEFAPLRLEAVPIPRDWSFLVAHSLTTAEKSGAIRAEYNLRRTAGTNALAKLGLASYREALASASLDLSPLDGAERRAFLHVTSEATRVTHAVEALRSADFDRFARLLNESHHSLRDHLRVSTPSIDELVEAARASGAAGARLTGAGFGGCVLMLVKTGERENVRKQLIRTYYSSRANFHPEEHLFVAEAANGALAS